MSDPIGSGSLAGSFSARFEAEDASLFEQYVRSRQADGHAASLKLSPSAAPFACPTCERAVDGLSMQGCTAARGSGPVPDRPGTYRLSLAAAVVRASPCGCVLAVDPVKTLEAMGVSVRMLPYGDETDEGAAWPD